MDSCTDGFPDIPGLIYQCYSFGQGKTSEFVPSPLQVTDDVSASLLLAEIRRKFRIRQRDVRAGNLGPSFDCIRKLNDCVTDILI